MHFVESAELSVMQRLIRFQTKSLAIQKRRMQNMNIGYGACFSFNVSQNG